MLPTIKLQGPKQPLQNIIALSGHSILQDGVVDVAGRPYEVYIDVHSQGALYLRVGAQDLQSDEFTGTPIIPAAASKTVWVAGRIRYIPYLIPLLALIQECDVSGALVEDDGTGDGKLTQLVLNRGARFVGAVDSEFDELRTANRKLLTVGYSGRLIKNTHKAAPNLTPSEQFVLIQSRLEDWWDHSIAVRERLLGGIPNFLVVNLGYMYRHTHDALIGHILKSHEIPIVLLSGYRSDDARLPGLILNFNKAGWTIRRADYHGYTAFIAEYRVSQDATVLRPAAMHQETEAASRFMTLLRQAAEAHRNGKSHLIPIFKEQLSSILRHDVPDAEKAFAWMVAQELWKVLDALSFTLSPQEFYLRGAQRIDKSYQKLARGFIELHEKVLDIPEVYRVLKHAVPLDPNKIWRSRTIEDEDFMMEACDRIRKAVVMGMYEARKALGDIENWRDMKDDILSAGVTRGKLAHGRFDDGAFASGGVPLMLEQALPPIVWAKSHFGSDPNSVAATESFPRPSIGASHLTSEDRQQIEEIATITAKVKYAAPPEGVLRHFASEGVYLPSPLLTIANGFKALGLLHPGDRVLDCGSGLGHVVFMVVQLFGAISDGREIDPTRLHQSVEARKMLETVAALPPDRARFTNVDFLKLDFRAYDMVYYYAFGAPTEYEARLFEKVEQELKPGARFVILAHTEAYQDQLMNHFPDVRRLLESDDFTFVRAPRYRLWVFTRKESSPAGSGHAALNRAA